MPFSRAMLAAAERRWKAIRDRPELVPALTFSGLLTRVIDLAGRSTAAGCLACRCRRNISRPNSLAACRPWPANRSRFRSRPDRDAACSCATRSPAAVRATRRSHPAGDRDRQARCRLAAAASLRATRRRSAPARCTAGWRPTSLAGCRARGRPVRARAAALLFGRRAPARCRRPRCLEPGYCPACGSWPAWPRSSMATACCAVRSVRAPGS